MRYCTQIDEHVAVDRQIWYVMKLWKCGASNG